MESLDIWWMNEELSVVQAALLIAKHDPAIMTEQALNWDVENRPVGYEAAKQFVCYELRSSNLAGVIEPREEYNSELQRQELIKGSIDLKKSKVSVPSLRSRLAFRRRATGLFPPEGGIAMPEYLNKQHERYAPKLAAAVYAWTAVDDPKLLEGKSSAKQALAEWLREHAVEFEMADDNGKPIEMAIDGVAKVANWRTTGGAPKTEVFVRSKK